MAAPSTKKTRAEFPCFCFLYCLPRSVVGTGTKLVGTGGGFPVAGRLSVVAQHLQSHRGLADGQGSGGPWFLLEFVAAVAVAAVRVVGSSRGLGGRGGSHFWFVFGDSALVFLVDGAATYTRILENVLLFLVAAFAGGAALCLGCQNGHLAGWGHGYFGFLIWIKSLFVLSCVLIFAILFLLYFAVKGMIKWKSVGVGLQIPLVIMLIMSAWSVGFVREMVFPYKRLGD